SVSTLSLHVALPLFLLLSFPTRRSSDLFILFSPGAESMSVRCRTGGHCGCTVTRRYLAEEYLHLLLTVLPRTPFCSPVASPSTLVPIRMRSNASAILAIARIPSVLKELRERVLFRPYDPLKARLRFPGRDSR